MNIATYAYFIIISVITFLAFGVDKWKAVHNHWRIRESALIGLCVLGGSLGGLLGMYIFHHKVRKPAFSVGIPAILVVQIMIMIMFIVFYKGVAA